MQKENGKKNEKTGGRWTLCEAFALQGWPCGDDLGLNTIEQWSVSCGTNAEAKDMLRKAVKERVEEYWEGAGDEKAVESDIEEVMMSGFDVSPNVHEYRFGKEDRMVVWRIFRKKKVDSKKPKGGGQYSKRGTC